MPKSKEQEQPRDIVHKVESLIYGQDDLSRELRTERNSYGYTFERYSDLVFGDNCLDNLQVFADGAKQLLTERQENNPSLQLATITTCLDLSQAMIHVVDRQSLGRSGSQLSRENITEATRLVRTVLDTVVPDSALSKIIKIKIGGVFDLYEEHPLLMVDVPMRDYEIDVLGSVLFLDGAQVGDMTSSALLGIHDRIVQGQPTRFAKGLLGFRDTSDRLGVVARVDDEDIAKRIGYSFEEYYDLDFGQKDYLSGTYDMEQAIDRHRRSLIIGEVGELGDFFRADNKQTALFQESHRPIVRAIIESSMGLSLGDVPIETQFEFLRYCTTRSEADYDRLGKVMESTPDEDRLLMFQSFLATEFGDDFGDKLLTIAENVSNESLHQILEAMAGFRDFSKEFSGWFKSYGSEFSVSVGQSVNERLTDALTVLSEVADKGSVRVDVSPNDANLSEMGNDKFLHKYNSVEGAIEDLTLANKDFKLKAMIMSDPETIASRVTEPNGISRCSGLPAKLMVL